MRPLLIAIAVLLGATSAAGVQAQTAPRPIALSARPLFGDQLLLPNAHVPVLVNVQNRTDRTISGRVVIEVHNYMTGKRRYEIAADLPSRESRQVVLTPYIADGGSVQVSYRMGGRSLSSTTLTTAYSPALTGLVLLDNPSHLRGALLEMEVEEAGIGAYGAPRMVRLPIGTVPADARSADPILPRDAVAWSAVGMLISSAPAFERVGAPERAAILDWVRTGGQLLLFTRSDADVNNPALSELLGEVELSVPLGAGETTADTSLVPTGAEVRQLSGPGVRSEMFGGSRRIGFGRIFVATFEGTSPRFASADQTRELVRAIISRHRAPGIEAATLPFARYEDQVSQDFFGGGPSFSSLRPSLDPNEGYRPALALVAVVLLFYVLLVGPLNFTFVGRRGKPTLALLTTPIAAIGCLAVLLLVGYLGKGVTMRHRSVEVVELFEGESAGSARRYGGLFLTRPASFDLPSPDRGIVRQIGDTSDAPVSVDDGERTTLSSVRGGLWETVFVREDRIADVGGEILFERAGRRVVAVLNRTPHVLRGAVIIDGIGGVYRVGDLSAGGRAIVPAVTSMTLATPNAFWGPEDYAVTQFAELMGFPADQKEILDGVSKVFGGNFTVGVPVLFAVAEIERDDVAGTFSPELDYTFVRVVPDLEKGDLTP
jgi:hypothetical protein